MSNNGAEPITTGTGELSPVLTCTWCGRKSGDASRDTHGWDAWSIGPCVLCPECAGTGRKEG